MAEIYRTINQSFWTDSKVDDDFTPEDKYFMLYLLTNPHTQMIGCYEISMKQMERETGYNEDTVKRLIHRLQDSHKVIKFDFNTKEVLIVNYWKYNWNKSPAVLTALKNKINDIKSEEFKHFIIEKMNNLYGADKVCIPYGDGIDTLPTPYGEGIDTLPTPYDDGIDTVYTPYGDKETVTETVTETDTVTEKETSSDEDVKKTQLEDSEPKTTAKENDNEMPKVKSPKAKKPKKKKYGDYSHVLLTDDEYAKLHAEYPNADEIIRFLDEYIEEKGYTSKSHYLAIKRWVVSAVEKRNREEIQKPRKVNNNDWSF